MTQESTSLSRSPKKIADLMSAAIKKSFIVPQTSDSSYLRANLEINS